MSDTYNKADLVKEIATGLEMSQAQVNRVIDSLFENILEKVRKGDVVKLTGLMTFSTIQVKERKGVNPKTKEKITIASYKKIKIKPGSNFKFPRNS